LEAFKELGQTWDLAGRCWRTLNRLTDVEGMKPGSGGEWRSRVNVREEEEAGYAFA